MNQVVKFVPDIRVFQIQGHMIGETYGFTFVRAEMGLHTYQTKSKQKAYKAAFDIGWTPEAHEAFFSVEIPDDPLWDDDEKARVAARFEAQQETERLEEEARGVLVESARAKLTEEEFAAVVQEGRN